jgi:hypothetical protein
MVLAIASYDLRPHLFITYMPLRTRGETLVHTGNKAVEGTIEREDGGACPAKGGVIIWHTLLTFRPSSSFMPYKRGGAATSTLTAATILPTVGEGGNPAPHLVPGE